jgi:predicted MFS family arabinose efflux permease
MTFVRRWLLITVLGFSGGIIFLLPFLFEVFYTPLGTALGLNHTELGSLVSIYGFVSMIFYFPGGWLADRVSPRKLITLSLITTGLAGLWFSTFPSYRVSLAIHAFWGVSITLLFWAAMIRLVRSSAPADQQGRAFGTLEFVRGIAEGLTYTGLLGVFAWLGSTGEALSTVVVQLSWVTIALGVVTWFVIEDMSREEAESSTDHAIGWQDVLSVLRMPVIWLIIIVVMTAYCAYWASFTINPYATDVVLTTAAVAGAISVARMWLKPVSGFIAGFVADRIGVAVSTIAMFAMLVVSFLGMAALSGNLPGFNVMLGFLAVAAIAIFGLRGIYFALLEEGNVPLAVTGTAGGVISAVAFTPDVFMPLLSGVLRDAYPGAEGYRYLFLITAGLSAAGLIASLAIYVKYVRPQKATCLQDGR